ncbi:MAG TPA: nucleotide sugar dehydrogenase, partial [Tepidisphaeraceae bacterium]|nr:nucleotide sugar dehydrogenase [Tepidisphaeraceae bacterium]
MDVTVIGCGYVGLVTGTCLASIGHTVRGVEKDEKKLRALQDGHAPFFEPGLQELMQENYASGQLQFSHDVKSSVKSAEVVFLCVGTPSLPDGTVDMSFLKEAGKEVCDALAELKSTSPLIIVVKSTVPAGTNRKLQKYLREHTTIPVDVISNPEFLKEGTAVEDCMRPDRIVIGGESVEAFRIMRRLYDPLVKSDCEEMSFLTMGWESAELTKYAANSMLAARISFMNEMTILCEHYGADIEDIRKGIGTDSRIGLAFLKAGCGY